MRHFFFENGTSQHTSPEQIAILCLTEINRRFPVGGINLLKNIVKFPNQEALEQTVKLIESVRLPVCNRDLPIDLEAGYCDHLSSYSLQYIQQHYPNVKVELVGFDAHVLLIINRAYPSNSLDMTTWGRDAILFDPWAERIIKPDLTNGFSREKLLELPDNPFCRDFSDGNISDQHYMAGNGKIAMTRTLQEYAFMKNIEVLNQLKADYRHNMCLIYKVKSDKELPDIDCCFRRAASAGHLMELTLLHYLGANMLAASSNGYTALEWARNRGHKDCIDFLVSQIEEQQLHNPFTGK